MIQVVEGQLGFQYFPPGQHPLHQGPHSQLAGYGQGLVQMSTSDHRFGEVYQGLRRNECANV